MMKNSCLFLEPVCAGLCIGQNFDLQHSSAGPMAPGLSLKSPVPVCDHRNAGSRLKLPAESLSAVQTVCRPNCYSLDNLTLLNPMICAVICWTGSSFSVIGCRLESVALCDPRVIQSRDLKLFHTAGTQAPLLRRSVTSLSRDVLPNTRKYSTVRNLNHKRI